MNTIATVVPAIDDNTKDIVSQIIRFFETAPTINIILLMITAFAIAVIISRTLKGAQKTNEALSESLKDMNDAIKELTRCVSEVSSSLYTSQTLADERNEGYKKNISDIAKEIADINKEIGGLRIDFVRFAAVRCNGKKEEVKFNESGKKEDV